MSRIGKQPVEIPSGVQVTFGQDGLITVKGPKGQLARTFHPLVEMEANDKAITVKPKEETAQARSLWGLSRTLLNNMVVGVSQGFKRVLEINGVGYRAEVNGSVLKMALGFSHPVEFQLPQGIEGQVDRNTVVTLSGIDKEQLGQTCATIRAFRPPEPYKGKGVKYAEEVIRRKVGKTGAK